MNRNLFDGLNFASKLTPKRVANAAKGVVELLLVQTDGTTCATGIADVHII